MNNQPKRPPMVERMKKRLQANLKVNLSNFNIPLGNGETTPKLKDVLETDVDERYYLKQPIVEKIVKESDFKERLVSIKIDKEEK